MKKVWLLIASTVILCMGVKTNSSGEITDHKPIRCAGIDISQGRMRTTSSLFMKSNPNIKVDLVKGEALNVGIDSLLNGKADVAITCRQINRMEKDKANQQELALSEKRRWTWSHCPCDSQFKSPVRVDR